MDEKPLVKPSVNNEDDEEEQMAAGCGASPACNPNHVVHRFIMLIFMCFLNFGSYYCFDSPAALINQITDDMNVSTSTYVLLYSLYSWPNVVLCFFGGFLIDRVFGIRFGAVFFGLFVVAGQIIFATGAYVNHFWLMEAGRFIFGIGGESLAVCQNTYQVLWFKGKELNLVFGIGLSFSRIGSTINMNANGPVYNLLAEAMGVEGGYKVLGLTLYTGAFLCLFSLGCALTLWYFDKRAARILKREEATDSEVISIKDVKDFPATLWLIWIICVAYYVAVFPFIGLGKIFFMEKFGFTAGAASAINSIVYLISTIASPLTGIMVDRLGRNLVWVTMGVGTALLAHCLMAFTFISPYVAMSVLGLSYSFLACALWPMVALVVPFTQLGTAYGFMQSIQNLGLAVIPLIAGDIVDAKGYLWLEVFFCACVCIALIATALLYIVDSLRGTGLNLSRTERAQRAKRAESSRREEEEAARVPEPRLRPRTGDQLRARYLSRLGAQAQMELEPTYMRSLGYRSVLR